MADLRVTVDDLELEADWTDDAPETRRALEEALPLSGDAVRWGEELYFDVPVDAPAENAREAVPKGAIAYWPPGSKLCLFWGETPASVDGEPRAASPVDVVARLSDTSALEEVDGGARVRLERLE
ncbi:cyclophilin-like fold protein [Natrarchaeobius sp. A-rgal3]|uniref:cyclophilin-like fold protein n=1 Tax=Natrarchaeobius versutus TaxID=1679078 RepID=UPI0035107079